MHGTDLVSILLSQINPSTLGIFIFGKLFLSTIISFAMIPFSANKYAVKRIHFIIT